MRPGRRQLLLGLAGLLCAPAAARPALNARVVVIGGGFGGATAAKYLKLWQPSLEVVLVEREASYVSCPLSNLVLAGHVALDELGQGYDGLRRHGVQVVHDTALGIDATKKLVRTARGGDLRYDRLVVSPGIDFVTAEIDGCEQALRAGRLVHGWKPGAQTALLRRQLVELRDGGTFVLCIPPSPFRCLAAPYERACQVAAYFRRAKPRSKVLVYDANPSVVAKGEMFRRAWKELYRGIVEYHPSHKVTALEPDRSTVHFEFDQARGDVLNVVPPQRAGDLAAAAGLITHNRRWCDVDWRSLESRAVPGIHVLGDATLAPSGMPKNGHAANSMGKVCAAAVIALLEGREPDPAPILSASCWSYVSEREAGHALSIHRYDSAQRTLVAVKDAASMSTAGSVHEGHIGWAWARNIWADSFG